MSLLLASGSERFDELLLPFLKDDFQVLKTTVDLRRFLVEKVEETQPTILLVHDKLHSDFPDTERKVLDDEWVAILEKIRVKSPETRIVFFATRKDNDPFLLRLIHLGVYDIFVGNQFDPHMLVKQLKEPASLEKVIHLKNRLPAPRDVYANGDLEARQDVGIKTISKVVTSEDEEEDEADEEVVKEEENDKSDGFRKKLESGLKKGKDRLKVGIQMPSIQINLPSINLGRTANEEFNTAYLAFAAKIITIASVAGGVGKTDVANNLACALKEHTDSRIVVVDFSCPYGGIAQALKLKRERTIADWMFDYGHPLTESGIKHKTVEHFGIDYLPMSANLDDCIRFNTDHAAHILDALKRVYDIVIVDCNGSWPVSKVALERSSEIILVTTHDAVAISNVLNWKCELLDRYGLQHGKISLFINQVPDDEDITKEDIAGAFDDDNDETAIPVIGYAPFDDSVRIVRNQGGLFYSQDPNHPFSVGMDMILDAFSIVPMAAIKRSKPPVRKKWFSKS
ncbi:CpaE family protein [Brevibacillus sp. NPDC003359]|uniref:AAA family ATPase n=1 Tax=unclassified Brevibacillus TaxID=2684853 RepID=UPI00367CA9C5